MKKHQIIRERLIPYRILAYLLYSQTSTWLERQGQGRVRLSTGPASRFLRLKSSLLWEALFWLQEKELVAAVVKEDKRGYALITLKGVSIE
jgi:hypothetical protein